MIGANVGLPAPRHYIPFGGIKEILKVEQEEDVSAIVIGSKGKSGTSGLFLGSVSEKVVRRSKTSVVVVK